MGQEVRKVTIYRGTTKYLATSYEAEQRSPDSKMYRITFKPKGTRNLRALDDLSANTIILDGWDHPEFNALIRGLEEATVHQLSDGVTYQMVSEVVVISGKDTQKSKYAIELENYLASLPVETILLDIRERS